MEFERESRGRFGEGQFVKLCEEFIGPDVIAWFTNSGEIGPVSLMETLSPNKK
jgi:hypothetical protein